MVQPESESRRYAYADYFSLHNDTRWEPLDGEAYALRPAMSLSSMGLETTDTASRI